jgi:hypothetical protein
VLDAGAWFRARRHVQAVADAGALAGAQKLPADTTTARSLAGQYVTSNGGNAGTADIQVQTTYRTNDTMSVTATEPVRGFFSRLFGITEFSVNANAKATVVLPASAQGVAPFAVDYRHQYLTGAGCPCFNRPTELDLDRLGPGAFKVINIDGTSGGLGQSVLANWILNGYPNNLGLGWFYSDPGAKFNPSQVQDALRARIGSDLMFPVYSDTRSVGSNLQYKLTGWTGFHLTGYSTKGSSGIMYGWFTQIVWNGTPTTDDSQVDYGGHTIELSR